MKKIFIFLFLSLALFLLGGCAAKATTPTTPPQAERPTPSPATATPTKATASPSGPAESVALWRAKGRFFLGIYRHNDQPLRWETLASLTLPEATNWYLAPANSDDTIWLLSENEEGWTFWTLNLQTRKLTKVFHLKRNAGGPLWETTWRGDEASVVLQDDANAKAPCWRMLNVRTGQIQDLMCATGKNAVLSGKNTAFPLGWLDDHTLYGLHWGIVTTPPTPTAPNVHATGKWSLLLWDTRTKHLQELALPELPSSYRHPDVLTARVQRGGAQEVTIIALASDPAEAPQCPTFVATTTWDTAHHAQGAKPSARCLHFPVMDTFSTGKTRLWMVPDSAKFLGRGLVVEQNGEVVFRLTLPAFWHWGRPWEGTNRPQAWRKGLVLKTFKMNTAASLGALYWLPPEGGKMRQIPFPNAPQDAMPNAERVDFLIVKGQ